MEQNEIPQTGVQEGANPVEAIPADLTMEQLLNQGDLNLDMPKPGDARTGMIASISDEEVLVSIGAKSEGGIPARELQAMSPEERANLKVGQEIQGYIVGSGGNKGSARVSTARSPHAGP